MIGGYAATLCQHKEKEVFNKYEIKSICQKSLFIKTVLKCVNCKKTFISLIEIKESN
jgi:hypothetical protein